MTKKFALLGDVHFGCRSDSITHMNFIAKFFDEVFFPRLKKEGIKLIFQLGDFMDRRKFVNYNTLSHVKSIFLDRCRDEGIEVKILVGNHDIYWRDTVKLNSIQQLFDGYKNVQCIDEPTQVQVADLKIDIIPWICKENEDQIMQFLTRKNPGSILLGHLEFGGFPMYKGMVAEHGMEVGEAFQHYTQIFTGHYHTHSIKGNIEYLGTPYEITWADAGDSKGYGIYDVETGLCEFIYNPYRIFHKLVYNDKATRYDKFDVSPYKQAYVKIFVEHRKSEASFDKFLERLYNEADPIDVTITDMTVSYSDTEIQSLTTQDPLSILLTSVDEGMKDAKEIRKLIQDIHSEVLQNGASE